MPTSTEAFDRLSRAAARAALTPGANTDEAAAMAESVADALDEASGIAPRVASGAGRREIVRTVVVPESHRPRASRLSSDVGLTITRPSGLSVEGGIVGLAGALGEALGQIGEGEQTVASIRWRDSYPETRQLGEGGPADEMRVASGGVPGPAEAIYDVATLGDATRPLRDSLPRFLATRGAVTLNRSPLLSAIVVDSGSGSAVTTVTSAQDFSGTTKGVQPISPPTATTATVRACAQRLQFGNFSDRFLPEATTAWVRLTLTAAARRAESLLLADIATESLHYSDTPASYGAIRDAKRAISAMVAELRDRERDYTTRIMLAVPSYAIDMFVADLVAQAPGDTAWSISRDDVLADMRTWGGGVDPVVLLDSTATNGRTLFTPITSGRTAGFDADVDVYLWWAPSLLFLDGGQLDLGILRDTLLSATNSFQTFFETWEALVRIGSQPLRATLSLCAGGGSQIPTAISVCSPQGS